MLRLPFLGALAIALAALTAVAVTIAWSASGGAIASPGALSSSRGDGARRHGVVAHAALATRCAACHPAPWSTETTSDLCLHCHDEIRTELRQHNGLHGSMGPGSGCLTCHTEHQGSSAALTRMDLASFPHDATGFSLAAHRETRQGRPFGCPDCHARGWRFEEAACPECHRNDSGGFLEAHRAAWGDDCRACHDGKDRFGEGHFDHGRTSFALAGRHATALCADCHAGATAWESFRRAPADCVGCHRDDDAHQGHFGGGCGECHRADGWKPATFDHARSSFPLTGAHARVACAACHAGERFEGTPRACVACQEEPADHRQVFGQDCASCHGTDTWRGASLQHDFPLDHGGDGRVACATCHPSSLRTYVCTGCHEHSADRLEREHREEGIADLRDCVRCHPTGREHEGGRDQGERREGRDGRRRQRDGDEHEHGHEDDDGGEDD